VRPGASWCSQCYADLRPAPEPVVAPIIETPAIPAEVTASANASATLLVEAPELVAESSVIPATTPGVVPMPVEHPVSWPCGRCRTLVPFDEDECPDCHTKFLASPLPGADKSLLDKLPQGQRKASTAFMVMIFGGLMLTGAFIGLFALLGAIFN
jgi:hypothetical protein